MNAVPGHDVLRKDYTGQSAERPASADVAPEALEAALVVFPGPSEMAEVREDLEKRGVAGEQSSAHN